MKKTFIFAALAIIAASCSKDELNLNDSKGENLTIFVGNEPSKTRLVNGAVQWLSADKLMVFNAEGNGTVFTTTDSGKETAQFTTASWPGGTPVYASHSSIDASEAACENGVLTVKLSPSQKIIDEVSYGREGSVTVGAVTGEEGSYAVEGGMKNVNGLVKFSIIDPQVAKIEVEAVGGEAIAGTVKVDYAKLAAGTVPFWSAVEGKTTSKIEIIPGGAIVKRNNCLVPGYYYVSVLPQTYSQGLKFTLKNANDEVLYTSTVGKTGFTVNRSESRIIKKALDDNLPETVVLTLDFQVEWPLTPGIVAVASQTDAGEEYYLEYKYDYKGTPCTRYFGLIFGRGNSEKSYTYIQSKEGAYKPEPRLNAVLFNSATKDQYGFIRIPVIPGKVLSSFKIGHNNGYAKQFEIRKGKTYNDRIAAASNAAATATATFVETVSLDTKGNPLSEILDPNFRYYLNMPANVHLTELELTYVPVPEK